MFPGINTQQRCIFAHHRVLICISLDLNLTCLVVFYKPRPTTALNACECGIEFALEISKGAVGRFDCCLNGAVSTEELV